MRRILFIVLITAASASAIFLGAQTRNVPKSQGRERAVAQLLGALEHIANSNNVSMESILQDLVRFQLSEPLMPKGGIGIVFTNLYVDVDGHTNRILLNDRWLDYGKRNEERLIIVSRGKVVGDIVLNDGDATFLRFKTNRIEFLDWAQYTGGHYARKEALNESK